MIQSDRTSAGEKTEAYCPHCFLLVEADVPGAWPPKPTRCPHCKLMIGPGRARPTSEAQPGARGTAAGVFAQQRAAKDKSLPSLSEVFAAFGSWKRARRESANTA
jgi:hypothetical protein